MKISISNIAWDVTEDVSVARLMRQYGVTGIEIAPTKRWADIPSVTSADVMEYRDYWLGLGFPVVALQSLLFGRPDLLLFGAEHERDAAIRYLKQIITIGSGLGAGPLVFGSPKNRQIGPLPHDVALSTAVAFFRELAEFALANNTFFCVEPNPAQYGCDFVRTAADARELAAAVDHPGFGIHLDAGIMTINGENVVNEIDQTLPWLRHFHISEPNLAVIGSDRTDHGIVADALRTASYDGWVSIEMRNGWMSPDSAAVEQALRTVQRHYQG